MLAPDRHHRFPDGLRHHRHRARHRAGEIQTARRRRHAEDRQSHRAGRPCDASATTTQEIERIIAHIEKYDTIEDVEENGETIRSGLKPEHLPVFDCAFKPYRGKRSIHYLAHLKMMAAAQPFISGAISKTVNMPNECTVEDIRDAYVQAWKMGLKCVAIYRDGSKRSQPLNTKKTNEGGDKTAAPEMRPRLEARIKELEAEVAQSARAGRQAFAPPPARHAHGHHPQVRYRRP